MAGCENDRLGLNPVDASARSLSVLRTVRRPLILTCILAFTALLIVWGLLAATRKASGTRAGFAFLLSRTPLAGILTSDLCIVVATTTLTLLLIGSKTKSVSTMAAGAGSPRDGSGGLR